MYREDRSKPLNFTTAKGGERGNRQGGQKNKFHPLETKRERKKERKNPHSVQAQLGVQRSVDSVNHSKGLGWGEKKKGTPGEGE